MSLSTLDMIIIGIYFVLIMYHGWWAGKKHQGEEDYFLAGRCLPWYLIGLSLYASNMSGSSFIGLMGATYANGMVVFNYEWTATLVLVIFALFMLPTFLEHRIETIPAYLEKRFDRTTRLIFSGFTILAIIFIDTAGALYAGGLVMTMLFPVLDLWQAVAVLGLVAGIYTLWGGLSAVVITDAVQAVLLIIAAIIVTWIGLDAVGGWDNVVKQIPESHTKLFHSSDSDFLPWHGIGGVILLGFYYWTLNQFIAQRTLGAKTLRDGQKGALFAGLLKMGNLFIMIVPGLVGLALYPELASADQVFPHMVNDMLPAGIKGIVLAGLIAAIMSSLDSALNAGASLITLDYIKSFRGENMNYLKTGKWVTGILMVIAICYAPTIAQFETLFEYVQSVLAYTVPTIIAVYFAGLFNPHVPTVVAKHTLWIGIGIGVAMFICIRLTSVWADAGLPDIHYTVMALLLFVVEMAFLWISGLFTKRTVIA
ncbi:MAG: SSS family solute/sodium (Na+) symporter [Rickettsiales bacterium]|nr:SSS family solute/sodium (Na+) symporter [Rickettsiales bacterium]